MLAWLTDLLSEQYRFFHVFDYVTFRAILSALTALGLSLALGPWVIRKLQVLQIGQHVRDDGPQSHLSKQGTPTMGGILIILSIVLSTLIWANLKNLYVWILLFSLVSFGAIGWYDDALKLIYKRSKGLSARGKFLCQAIAASLIVTALYALAKAPTDTQLLIPFLKAAWIPLGLGFLFFGFIVIVGSSNAVNLTDGLDGLAILPVVLVGAGLGVFAYLSSHAVFSEYLLIPFVPRASEAVIFVAALAGAGLGFLWFNSYPAQIFMGDVGALGLGAALGTLAIMVRQELVLCVMGGVFVAETLSVIIQVLSFKWRGKRVFKMAPLHHHYELSGWPEPKVVVRFWIVTVVLVLVGLATLKLR